MPVDRRVDYIELPAADLAKARQFYESVFDWKFTEFGSDYLAFSDGSIDGGFYRSDLAATTEQGAALVVVYAERLEELRDYLLSLGGRLTKDIFSFPGGRRFQFLDPHGNELAVWSDR